MYSFSERQSITEAYRKVCEGFNLTDDDLGMGNTTDNHIDRNGNIHLRVHMPSPYKKVERPERGHWIVSELDADGNPVAANGGNGANANTFQEFTSFDELRRYCTGKIKDDVPISILEVSEDGNESTVSIRNVVRPSRMRDDYLERHGGIVESTDDDLGIEDAPSSYNEKANPSKAERAFPGEGYDKWESDAMRIIGDDKFFNDYLKATEDENYLSDPGYMLRGFAYAGIKNEFGKDDLIREVRRCLDAEDRKCFSHRTEYRYPNERMLKLEEFLLKYDGEYDKVNTFKKIAEKRNTGWDGISVEESYYEDYDTTDYDDGAPESDKFDVEARSINKDWEELGWKLKDRFCESLMVNIGAFLANGKLSPSVIRELIGNSAFNIGGTQYADGSDVYGVFMRGIDNSVQWTNASKRDSNA